MVGFVRELRERLHGRGHYSGSDPVASGPLAGLSQDISISSGPARFDSSAGPWLSLRVRNGRHRNALWVRFPTPSRSQHRPKERGLSLGWLGKQTGPSAATDSARPAPAPLCRGSMMNSSRNTGRAK